MRSVQDILFNVTGQSLVFDAPEGRPSSVTSVSVYRWNQGDDETAESAVSGSASVETSPNTTTDADMDSTTPTVLPLTSTTGTTAGRVYLAIGTTGEREWIEVAKINAGVSIEAKHPIHNLFLTGSTFQSTRITATVDSTWVADLSNMLEGTGPNPQYRVRWVYVVSGSTYVADTYFNLVRYAGKHGVLPEDIEAMIPGWLDALPVDHRDDQGRRLIDEAYRAVKLDLHSVLLDDATVANTDVIDELTRYKTVENTQRSRVFSGAAVREAFEIARADYVERRDYLIRITNKTPIRDHTGGAKQAVALGLTRR